MSYRLKKQFEKRLTFLLYGTKGGENRIKIIEALRGRPYNMNQLSTNLGLNYRTIKYHITKLIDEEILSTTGMSNYGNIISLSPDLEANMEVYERIINKINR